MENSPREDQTERNKDKSKTSRPVGKKIRDSEKKNHPKMRLRDPSKTPARFRDWAKILRDPCFSRYHSTPLCLNSLIKGSLFESGMDLKDCVALKIIVRKPSYSTLFIYLFAFFQFDVSSLSGQNVILNGSQDLLYVSEKVNNILPPINTLVNIRLENVSFRNSTSHSLNSLWCWYYEVKFADDHCFYKPLWIKNNDILVFLLFFFNL